MRKIILFSFLIAMGAIVFFPVLSLADNNNLDAILNEIKKSQNVSEISQINCDKVSEQNFEHLGNSVMGLMLPNENDHQLMDQMMGGEGSQSLKAMHTLMGKRYLGCVQGVTGSGMMGYGMGQNMMNQNMMNRNIMGQGYYYGGFWLGLIYQILVLIFLLLAIFALIKWLSKNNK